MLSPRQSKTRPSFRRNEKKTGYKTITFITLIFLTIGAFGYVLFFTRIFNIRNINISGTVSITQDEARAAAKQAMNKTFAGNNALFVNTGSISSAIEKIYPVVTDVNIRRKLNLSLDIEITERATSFVLKTQGNYYLVGNDGVVVQPTDGIVKDFPILNDLANAPVTLGQKHFSKQFVTFLDAASAGLRSLNIPVINFAIPETTFELRAEIQHSYEIRFDTTADFGEQLEKYKLVVSYFKRGHIRPASYVDLSIPNRVYYK